MGFSRLEPSVALYCRKVLIDAQPKDLLPEWLRFLKGVVDSEDLPLNISRESMQDRSLVEKLNRVITKRFLKFLEEEAKDRPESFGEFYKEFGVFLKEGAALDFSHKDALTKLLRFESSLTDKGKTTSLADYVSRMAGGPEGHLLHRRPEPRVDRGGPLPRGLPREEHGGPVLLRDRRRVRHEQRARVRRQEADGGRPRRREALRAAEGRRLARRGGDHLLVGWLKESLGERVADVRASDRLVDSPALATNADKMGSPHMRRLMKAMNKDGAQSPSRVNLG